MKIFLLFLLTLMGITAAPHASAFTEHKLQQLVLAEIVQNIKETNDSLTEQILVQKVITTEDCTHKNLCKAHKILSVYKAEDLGLKEKDWLLPRQLEAYIKDINCKDPASEDQITLLQLLDSIYHCAKKEYSKPFDVSTRSSLN